MTRPRSIPRAAREQAIVLLRAFEAGAFDEYLGAGRGAGISHAQRKVERQARTEVALVAVEEFLGATALPAALKAVRLEVSGGSVYNFPSADGVEYLRWLFACDLGHAIARRSNRGRDPAKKNPGR